MATSRKKPTKDKEPELEPDAWDRFKRTMDKIVPPRPHEADKKGAKRKPKGKQDE